LQDITARKQLEAELAHQALHDSLTGLPNRALLNDRLIQALARSGRRGTHVGVLLVDIDNFKMTNDTFGHEAGDDLLRHAATQTLGAARQEDTVARFGGDEFVVVCDSVSALEVEQIAVRILEAVRQPFHVGSHEVELNGSIGVAMAEQAATPATLLRDADTAMCRAKERGRNRIEIFGQLLRTNSGVRLATTSALHRALQRAEFTVHYQPIVELTTGAMVSVEALLRWDQPGRGIVSPAEFIPLAEETGLIVPIGAWVLEEACRQLVDWQRTQKSLSVAVNVSVRQMVASNIADLVADVLERTGLRPAGCRFPNGAAGPVAFAGRLVERRPRERRTSTCLLMDSPHTSVTARLSRALREARSTSGRYDAARRFLRRVTMTSDT
jgi:diguanylate cyclase (GGDEF)-like protein